LLSFNAMAVSANSNGKGAVNANAKSNGSSNTQGNGTPKGNGHGLGAATVVATPPTASSNPAPTGSTTGPGAGKITTPGKTGPGDNNRGDTWLQTVGPCADHNAEVLNHDADSMSACNLAVPGGNPEFEPPFEPVAENLQYAEIGTVEDTNPDHNPHLPCANIELMGKDMGDSSGPYSIDYWPPTGNKGGVYGKNSDGSSALSLPAMVNGDADVTNNGTWTYSAPPTTISKQGKTGGYQVMDIIDVSALVHNAQLINPDPHDIQGYHFKLQYTQDPQKHKTFWVKCQETPPPPASDCDGDHDGSLASDTDCQGPVDCDGDHDGSLASDTDCQGPVDCDGDHNGSVASDADCQGPEDCDGDHDGTVAGDAGCHDPIDCDGDHDGSTANDVDCTNTPQQDCDGDTDGSHTTDADCTKAVSGVEGVSTTTPSGGVLGASVTSPITGHPILSAMILALTLVAMGSVFLGTGLKRKRARD
jgi:hypothetical protein